MRRCTVFGVAAALVAQGSVANAQDLPSSLPPGFSAASYVSHPSPTRQSLVDQWMAPWRDRHTRVRTTGVRSVLNEPIPPVVVPSGATDLHLAALQLDISSRTWSSAEWRRHEPPSDYTHEGLSAAVWVTPLRHTLALETDPSASPRLIHSIHSTTSAADMHRTDLTTSGLYEYDENGRLTAFYEQTVRSGERSGGQGQAELLVFPAYDDAGLVSGWRSLRTRAGSAYSSETVAAPTPDVPATP